MTPGRGIERTILLQDLFVVTAALALSGLVRSWIAAWLPGMRPTIPPFEYAHLSVIFLPVWAICAERVQLNRPRLLVGPGVDLFRSILITQAWGAAAIALILVGAQVSLNRSLIAVFLLVSTVLLTTIKIVQRRWLRRHHGETLALVVDGAPREPDHELEWIRNRRLERLDAMDPARLRERLQQGGVDEVVLPGRATPAELRALMAACEDNGVPVLVPIEGYDIALVPPRAESVGRTLYLRYEAEEPGRPTRFLKLLLDYVVGGVLLLIALPVMALIAIVIRLTSPGPAIFVQQRGGLHGHPFPMLKFRTMKLGAEAERARLLASNEMDGPVFKIADDPRVTRFGRFLRHTSLDELPQLVNVMLGQMSLVGPRPLPLVETRALQGPHRRRLSVRPGITGLWQVSGRSDLGFEEWMTLDLQYVDTWNLGQDLAILLRTIPALLTRRGAH